MAASDDDVHVYHKRTGPYGTMLFYERGNLAGSLTLNPPAYTAVQSMLSCYSAEDVKVMLILVPADFDPAAYAELEERRVRDRLAARPV